MVRIVGTPLPDRLIGTFANDDIFGLGGNDTLFGSGGDDDIFGGSGNDRLLGDFGNDSLNGGSGNDTLQGFRAGNVRAELDTLRGGPGADMFVLGFADQIGYLQPGADFAIIKDFSAAEGDTIRVGGRTSQYTLLQNANVSGGAALDTRIIFNGGRVAVIEDTTNVSISRDFRDFAG